MINEKIKKLTEAKTSMENLKKEIIKIESIEQSVNKLLGLSECAEEKAMFLDVLSDTNVTLTKMRLTLKVGEQLLALIEE